jgi:hypothetical protein
MNARDNINQQLRSSVLFPTTISAQLLVIVVLLWLAIGAPPNSVLIIAFGIFALVMILGAYIETKRSVTCPFCTHPLIGCERLRKLPKEYHFCPTCGGKLDQETGSGEEKFMTR